MRTVGILFAAMVLASGQLMAQGSGARIVEEGALGKTFDLAAGQALVAPGYPQTYASTGDDVCIALGYTVNPDGTTGDFRLLSAWSSDRGAAERQERYLESFAGAAANAVSQWRFVPKDSASAQGVRTVTTMAFRGDGKTESLSDRCRIANLAVRYQQLATAREFKRSMQVHYADRDTQDRQARAAAAAIAMADRRGR